MDLEIVTVVEAGDRATLMPIGPSDGWPEKHKDVLLCRNKTEKLQMNTLVCFLKMLNLSLDHTRYGLLVSRGRSKIVYNFPPVTFKGLKHVTDL